MVRLISGEKSLLRKPKKSLTIGDLRTTKQTREKIIFRSDDDLDLETRALLFDRILTRPHVDKISMPIYVGELKNFYRKHYTDSNNSSQHYS